ncbi:MAG: hypothetical protein JWM32_793 [Verrucomicrobia bacterium]|nr:hypothetical protein [Verrucomicrobiota bacterium]
MILGISLLARIERAAAYIGVGATLAAVALAWSLPIAKSDAWECAALCWLGLALGTLTFVLVHQLTGGAWGRELRPYLIAGTRLLPWTCLLWLPLVVQRIRAAKPHQGWQIFAPGEVTARTAIELTVFAAIALFAVRAWPREGEQAKSAWIGPAGGIGVLFLTHLFVSDRLAILDHDWTSTAFPLVWLVGQSVAAFSFALLIALLAGANPAQPLGDGRSLGLDWGTLLFAAAMLWCYIAFAQFLIVWSGNIPAETAWYARRLHGAWRWMPLLLLVLHFLLPLFILLSRRAKQQRGPLAAAAAGLLVAQFADDAWLVIPAFPAQSLRAAWLAVLLIVAIGGLFMNRYLVLVRTEGGAR